MRVRVFASWRAAACAVLSVVALYACGSARASAPATFDADADAQDAEPLPTLDGSLLDAGRGAARYNQVQQKSVHNAYEHDEPLFDQVWLHRAFSLELDIHNSKRFADALARDWYVYHIDAPRVDRTSCTKLSDCMSAIRALLDLHPDHEVVTLLIDLKDPFDATHSVQDLDGMLQRTLGDRMVRPRELLTACPGATTLRAAVTAPCSFPSLATLRGRVIVGLTGGTACDPSPLATDLLHQYVRTQGDRAAFIVPGIDGSCPFEAYDRVGHVIFFNMNKDGLANVAKVRKAGLIARVYFGGLTGGLDEASYAAARAAGAHLLATDNVNYLQDPWSATHQTGGYPFRCIEGDPTCVLPSTSEERVLAVDVRSGDLEGTRDAFAFLHTEVTGDATWETAIAVPSSHVEPFAKGCFMARASLAPDSAYLAICRPADNRPMRAQYRPTTGADTVVVEGDGPTGQSEESTFFARLRARGNQYTVDYSSDGRTFKQLVSLPFASFLRLHGLAASGHDSQAPVRFVFGAPRRTDVNPSSALRRGPDVRETCIGTCAMGTWFESAVRQP
jgi:hypothetical protein